MTNHIRKPSKFHDRRITASKAIAETICGKPITDHDLSFLDGQKAVKFNSWPVCEHCANTIRTYRNLIRA